MHDIEYENTLSTGNEFKKNATINKEIILKDDSFQDTTRKLI